MTRTESQQIRRARESKRDPRLGPDDVTRFRCRKMFGMSAKAVILEMSRDGYSGTTIAGVLGVKFRNLKRWCEDWGHPEVCSHTPEKRHRALLRAWAERSSAGICLP